MTTDASADQAEYLSTLLLEKNGFTTYRTAARVLKVHPDTAKQLLYDFYNRNRAHLSASYITTGRSKNGVLVKLSTEEELKNDILAFEAVNTSHVYALLSKKATVSSSDVALLGLKNKVDHGNLEWHYEHGIIRGPALQTGGKALTTSVRPSAAKASSSVSYTPRKQAEKEEKTAVAPIKSKSELLSRYVSRKAEKKETPAKTTKQKPALQYTSRKNEFPKPKERVVISESAQDDDVDMDEPVVPKVPRSELQNLFLDNLSDFSEDEKTEEKDEPVIVPEPEEEKEGGEDMEAKTSVSANEVSEPSRSILTQLPTKSLEEPASAEVEVQQENTVDEDGYITSFSKRPAPPEALKAQKRPKTVPEATTSPANKPKDAKKKQTSLMNFFQKR